MVILVVSHILQLLCLFTIIDAFEKLIKTLPSVPLPGIGALGVSDPGLLMSGFCRVCKSWREWVGWSFCWWITWFVCSKGLCPPNEICCWNDWGRTGLSCDTSFSRGLSTIATSSTSNTREAPVNQNIFVCHVYTRTNI